MDVIKATDEIKVETIVLLLYGQPDAGKTSTACTANKTILIDCDRGAHRAKFRQDCVQPKGWGDIQNIAKASWIGNYDTIAVDTVGRLLEMISLQVNGDTIPKTFQQWGNLRKAFFTWIGSIRALEKDVVLLAHHKNETIIFKDGGREKSRKYVKPDIQGSSYEEVFKIADAVGFLYKEHDHRGIIFDGNQDRAGKNAARIAHHAIPDFSTDNQYLAKLITQIKDQLSGQANANIEMGEALKELEEIIEKVADAPTANSAFAEIQCAKASQEVKREAFVQLRDKCAAASILWNKDDQVFYQGESEDGPSADADSNEQPEPEPAVSAGQE